MRPERLTMKQAQAKWDDMKENIYLNGKKDGHGVQLPSIDMATIFHGRQSMTWKHIADAIKEQVQAWEPPI